MSLVQQPGDKAETFRIIKKDISRLKKDTNISPITPQYLKQKFVQENFLGKVSDSASKRTFKQFLIQLPELLERCLAVKHCREGWVKPGLWPYDAAKIMSYWPGWKGNKGNGFSTQQAQSI